MKRLDHWFDPRFCFIVLPVFFFISLFPLIADANEEFATDRFIVKFKDDAQDKVNSPSINSLKKKFKVKHEKRAFGAENGNSADAKFHQQQKFNDIKLKFAERQKRAPANAKMPDLSHVFIFETDSSVDIEQAVKEFKNDPSVEYAQPDFIMESIQAAPTNDPLINDSWGIEAIHAIEAWRLTKGDGIVVAVNDTGVDYNHEDLSVNMWTNGFEIENGIDDDGNGYVDDIKGWNFVSATNDPWDDHYHGTHVAGTIAAVDNNNKGVAGVAPHAKIMPLKALSATGSGYTSHLGKAIIYAAQNGADVVNNSWGCGSACATNLYIKQAIEYAYALGVVNVFASGNSSLDLADFGPNDMEEIISVNASTAGGTNIAYFSNRGALSDVIAPGTSIMSTAPGNTYKSLSGTSMAAPHVAGVAALVLAHNPGLNVDQVRAAIETSAVDILEEGFDTKAGHGFVDAFAALQVPAPLVVKLIDPLYNPTVDGSLATNLSFSGEIRGSTLQSYSIKFKKISGTVGPWTVGFGPSINFDGKYFGSLDLSTFPSATYLASISTVDTNGNEFERVTQFELINGGGAELPCTKAAPFLDDVLNYGKFPNEIDAGFTSSPLIYLRNQDSIDCMPTSYTVTTDLPAGWTDSKLNGVTLDPGKSISLGWKVNVPADAVIGQTYSGTIHVVDNNNSNLKSSLTVQWTIVYRDRTPPMLTIESPADGATLEKGRITIDVNAYDTDSGLSHIVVRVDGERLQDAKGRTQTTTWNASNATVGTHKIQVVAVDKDFNETEKIITVNLIEPVGGTKGGGGKGGGGKGGRK